MNRPFTRSEVETYYRTTVPRLNRRGPEWRGPCPIHKGKNPSFAVKSETGDWYCHSKCGRGGSIVDLEMARTGADFKIAAAEVDRIVGRPEPAGKRRIVAEYDYVDEDGTLLYQVRRTDPKGFSQRRPDGRGGWVPSIKGVRRVPYRLNKLKDAESIMVVEGEKDVQNLERLGFVATCNSEGAGKWRSEFGDALAGKRAFVFPDNDEPGRKHAELVVSTLIGKAAEVRIVKVPVGKDVSDWIAAGATRDTILEAIKAAPLCTRAGTGALTAADQDDRPLTQHPPGDELPEIIVSDRQLRDVSADSVAALQASNSPPNMFVREGEIVDIREKGASRHVVNIINDVQMVGILARVASYRRFTEHGRKVNCSPPLPLAKDILTRRDVVKLFPLLQAVTEVPVMRPDGTVVERPGYDPTTGLYFIPPPGLILPPIPDSPTDDDLCQALSVIDSAIADFPFVYDLDYGRRFIPAEQRKSSAAVYSASKANAVAALLTPVIRPVIGGPTPLGLVDAPAPGTGKTLFTEVLSIIATGGHATLFSAPTEEEEWRKQLTSYLSEGAPVVVIDNLSNKLESGQLSKALTATVWADRILGHTKTVRVPVRCTWLATGNNIELGGDIPRRCYWICMDAQVPRPHLRTGFRHANLRRWVADHRGELIGALLTLARGWFAAGKPQSRRVMLGSYEDWAEIMGGILEYVGVPGFMANSIELDERADADAEHDATFLQALRAVLKDQRFTSAELYELCQGEPFGDALRAALPNELREALAEDGLFQRRLGKWLGDRANRRFAEQQVFVQRAGSQHKVQLWQVLDPRTTTDGCSVQ